VTRACSAMALRCRSRAFAVVGGGGELLQPAAGSSRVRGAVEVAHHGLELAALVQQLAAVAKSRGARARALEEARDERRVARTASVPYRQELEPRERFVPDRSGRPLVASREDTEALARAALQQLLLELEELLRSSCRARPRPRTRRRRERRRSRRRRAAPHPARRLPRRSRDSPSRGPSRRARHPRSRLRRPPRVDREAQARVLDDRGDSGLDLRHRAVPRVVRAGHDPAETLRGPAASLTGLAPCPPGSNAYRIGQARPACRSRAGRARSSVPQHPRRRPRSITLPRGSSWLAVVVASCAALRAREQARARDRDEPCQRRTGHPRNDTPREKATPRVLLKLGPEQPCAPSVMIRQADPRARSESATNPVGRRGSEAR
jgi:hypothetical protein